MTNQEKYILVSLEEEKAKQLANVISNATSRKILGCLSTKDEASETEISKELNLPLSTVHYNLQQLKKNNLVETKHFMYSDKGKKIGFYRVVKKFIVIAPRYVETNLLKNILPLFLISALIAGIVQLFYGITTKTFSYTQGAIQKTPAEVQEAMNGVLQQADQGITSPVINETAQQVVSIITQTPNYYGLWFLFGAWFILIIYIIIQNLKKKS